MIPFEDFPHKSFDKLRLADTNGGHINNVVFGAYCETGRSEIIFDPQLRALSPGLALFVARFAIDYRAELFWPGDVQIGTGIKSLGRTSIIFHQGLFQNDKCAAEAESVLVQVDLKTSRPVPLSEASKAWLSRFLLP